MCLMVHTACVVCRVEALVYTSTYNVVFGGQEIVNGREEDLPYFPLHKVSTIPRSIFYYIYH